MWRFGAIPVMPRPCRFTTPVEAARFGHEAPSAGRLRPTHAAQSIYCDTRVEGRSCILGDDLIRDSAVLVAELVLLVDSGYS